MLNLFIQSLTVKRYLQKKVFSDRNLTNCSNDWQGCNLRSLETLLIPSQKGSKGHRHRC